MWLACMIGWFAKDWPLEETKNMTINEKLRKKISSVRDVAKKIRGPKKT